MLKEAFYLKFAWGPRKEDLDQCADRLAKFLSDLSIIDPAFATFLGGRKKERLYRMPIDPGLFKRWLAQGVNREEIGNAPIPDLGFSTSLILNEEDDVAFPLRIHCGCYAPRVPNICSIIFPRSGGAARRLLKTPMLLKIAKAVIENWQPDVGIISSDECRRISPLSSFASEAGWITYLPEKLNELTDIPASAQVEKIGNGRLIIATKAHFSSANSNHMEVVKHLAKSLQAIVG